MPSDLKSAIVLGIGLGVGFAIAGLFLGMLKR